MEPIPSAEALRYKIEMNENVLNFEWPYLEELDGALAFRQVSVADEMFPAEDGDEEEQGRNDPGDGHHPEQLVLGPPAAILGGDFHRTEAIDGDEQHRVLRHEADRVVDRQPQVAQDGTQVPVAHHHVHRVERHRHGADEHVGDGQWGDEVVARLPDGPFHDEGQQDENVAAHRQHDADAQADDDADALPHLERHGHLGTRHRRRRCRRVPAPDPQKNSMKIPIHFQTNYVNRQLYTWPLECKSMGQSVRSHVNWLVRPL